MEKKVYEFIADQTGEQILERKKCPECGEEFAITDKDMDFYDKVSPSFNGQRCSIPAPTLCPDCRQRRRLAWRNERKLYKRKCDLSGKEFISIYSVDKKGPIYNFPERRSDKWDPMDYGRDFDFNRFFFEQFEKLLMDVPKIGIFPGGASENSEYNNYTASLKDCYLMFDSMTDELCMYGLKTSFSKYALDCSYTMYGENCYSCSDCMRINNVFYSDHSSDCRDSYFISYCVGCNHCFGCVGLNNKQYYIFNKQYTKEEYNEIIKGYVDKMARGDIDDIQDSFKRLQSEVPMANLNVLNVENCFGENIQNSKDSQFCFDGFDLVNCKYSYRIHTSTDCQDYESWGDKSALIYEGIAIGGASYGVLFCSSTWGGSNNVLYSMFVSGGKDCFGCVGLRNKQYCILNKQYTKEEYEALVPKIIEYMKSTGERGEFFPASISPFGYNETAANDYFPLKRDETLKKGFKRQDKEYPINVPEGTELVKAQDLPDSINDVDDEILKKAIICEVSGKPFRIVKPELEFYRKHNLPLPRKHPDIRHLERLAKRAPRKLYLRTCDNCGKEVVSIYPQDSEFKVYCEECYNKEIY